MTAASIRRQLVEVSPGGGGEPGIEPVLRDDPVQRGRHRARGDDGGDDARRKVANPSGGDGEQRDHHPAQGQAFGRRLVAVLGRPRGRYRRLTPGVNALLNYVARPRHRLSEPEIRVDRASDDEVLALLGACRSARDRFIVVTMSRAGLRRGEVCGLRREDMHFVADASGLGCTVAGAHLHVRRRANANGAWAKSRRSRAVPVDGLVVLAYDTYVFERDGAVAASGLVSLGASASAATWIRLERVGHGRSVGRGPGIARPRAAGSTQLPVTVRQLGPATLSACEPDLQGRPRAPGRVRCRGDSCGPSGP